MTHVTCRLTAKNRDQLLNLTLSNRVWATFLSVNSDWLLHEESCPRLDLVHPGGALPLLVYTPNHQLESVAIAAQMVRTDAALLGALANGGCVVSHNSVYLFLPSFKLIIASLVVCRSALCTDGAVEPCCKLMCPRSPSQLPPS